MKYESLKLVQKLSYLGIFRLRIEQKLFLHLKQLRIFRAKLKILKFGTKIALFGCFGQQYKKKISKFEVKTGFSK